MSTATGIAAGMARMYSDSGNSAAFARATARALSVIVALVRRQTIGVLSSSSIPGQFILDLNRSQERLQVFEADLRATNGTIPDVAAASRAGRALFVGWPGGQVTFGDQEEADDLGVGGDYTPAPQSEVFKVASLLHQAAAMGAVEIPLELESAWKLLGDEVTNAAAAAGDSIAGSSPATWVAGKFEALQDVALAGAKGVGKLLAIALGIALAWAYANRERG